MWDGTSNYRLGSRPICGAAELTNVTVMPRLLQKRRENVVHTSHAQELRVTLRTRDDFLGRARLTSDPDICSAVCRDSCDGV